MDPAERERMFAQMVEKAQLSEQQLKFPVYALRLALMGESSRDKGDS